MECILKIEKETLNSSNLENYNNFKGYILYLLNNLDACEIDYKDPNNCWQMKLYKHAIVKKAVDLFIPKEKTNEYKKDINLTLNDGYLIVNAKKEEKEDDGQNYIRRENYCIIPYISLNLYYQKNFCNNLRCISDLRMMRFIRFMLSPEGALIFFAILASVSFSPFSARP